MAKFYAHDQRSPQYSYFALPARAHREEREIAIDEEDNGGTGAWIPPYTPVLVVECDYMVIVQYGCRQQRIRQLSGTYAPDPLTHAQKV